MSTFLQDVESIIKNQGEAGLIHLEHYSGVELELYREDNSDAYANAYGQSAGGTTSKIKEFIGVLQGDDFIQKSDHFSGNFEEGFLYCREVEIRVSDVIKIKSDDLVRKYKVESKKSIGLTKTVFIMYELTNLGD